MIWPHCWHQTSAQYVQKAEQGCWCGTIRREVYNHVEDSLHGEFLKQPEWYYDTGYNQPYFITDRDYKKVTEIPVCVERPVSPYAPMISRTKEQNQND